MFDFDIGEMLFNALSILFCAVGIAVFYVVLMATLDYRARPREDNVGNDSVTGEANESAETLSENS